MTKVNFWSIGTKYLWQLWNISSIDLSLGWNKHIASHFDNPPEIHSRVRTMTSLRSKDTLYVHHIHDWSSPSFSKEMTVYWQSRKHDRQKNVRAFRFPENIILKLKKLWPLCKLALCLSHVWTPSEGGGPITTIVRLYMYERLSSSMLRRRHVQSCISGT